MISSGWNIDLIETNIIEHLVIIKICDQARLNWNIFFIICINLIQID